MKNIRLPSSLSGPCNEIVEHIRSIRGRAVCVGGCIRDALLGIEAKDLDIEVFGVTPEALEAKLSQHYLIATQGKSFAVLSIRGLDIDISIPRKEYKYGEGHKGFQVNACPDLSFEEAAARRDFTINAISWDPLRNEIIDPFNGIKDLEQRRLKAIINNTFVEDPLRVLRAVQLAARFELTVDSETVDICRTMEPENLPRERIFEEWRKLILTGKKPSIGLQFLVDCGWINYYPELKDLIRCKQDPQWHPEGDVWVHTLHCMDAFAKDRIRDSWEDLIVGFGVLCHDLGKPTTSFYDESTGRIRSPRHEVEGEAPTLSFLNRMTVQKDLIESILPLVKNHLRPVELFKAKSTDAAIRRLARNVRIDRLLRVMTADMKGRPPLESNHEEVSCWLMERAEVLKIKDQAPQPIMQGRHLIQLGKQPSVAFGVWLNLCFEAQLDGVFETEEAGLKFLKTLIKKNPEPKCPKV